LADLKLQGTDFSVHVEHPASPGFEDVGPAGFDTVSFLFSANAGQEPAPLARIASGGELSRVMLALKAVLARKSGIETVIFDELDAGISGEVADMVGRKLRNLSLHGQVIAISHYPQIAAAAGLHISVEKAVENGVTTTEMRELEEEERVEEIARMLGGGTDDARAWAARLLGPVLRGA
jgi:DNA repair protein RecN (Recombination protein N)